MGRICENETESNPEGVPQGRPLGERAMRRRDVVRLAVGAGANLQQLAARPQPGCLPRRVLELILAGEVSGRVGLGLELLAQLLLAPVQEHDGLGRGVVDAHLDCRLPLPNSYILDREPILEDLAEEFALRDQRDPRVALRL